MSCIRRWANGREQGQWGWVGKLKVGHQSTDSGALFPVGDRDVHNPLHRSSGHRQQFDTPLILISASQQLHTPCNATTQFCRINKRLFFKADLAICSQVLDVSGWYMSTLLTLFIKLDFSYCANWDDLLEIQSHYLCITNYITEITQQATVGCYLVMK